MLFLPLSVTVQNNFCFSTKNLAIHSKSLDRNTNRRKQTLLHLTETIDSVVKLFLKSLFIKTYQFLKTGLTQMHLMPKSFQIKAKSEKTKSCYRLKASSQIIWDILSFIENQN